jgi:hypothetical protein
MRNLKGYWRAIAASRAERRAAKAAEARRWAKRIGACQCDDPNCEAGL